jgi:hypothetical protein
MEREYGTDSGVRTTFWVLLALLALGRLMLIGRFEFSTDEAHYVMYGRHLAWGYFDHPPMVGFLAALGGLMGGSEWAMRLMPALCGILSLTLMGLLARDLYGWWAALLAVGFGACVPILMLLGVALLPDSTLNVFWCAALFAGWRAYSRHSWGWWLLTGVMMGGAMLSKYHGVLLPLLLGLFLLTSREGRRRLLSPMPYAACVLALLVFLPNILWNAGHDWVSYAYQLGHGGGKGQLTPFNVLASLGGQLAAGTPILFVLMAVACILLWRKPRGEEDRFIVWTSLPVFLFFCGIGLVGKVLPHWPAPGWWAGLIGLAALLTRRLPLGGAGAIRWKRWTLAGVILGLTAVVLLPLMLVFPLAGKVYIRLQPLSESLHERFSFIKPLKPYHPKFDISNDVRGFRIVAAEVTALKKRMDRPDQTFVMAGRFYALSQTAAYLDPATPVWATRPAVNQYTFWFEPQAHKGWDAILIEDARDTKPERGIKEFNPLFESIEPVPVEVAVDSYGLPARRTKLWIGRGFTGIAGRMSLP